MRLHRISALVRPLDLGLASNRLALTATTVFLIGGSAARLVTSDPSPGEALLAGLQPAVGVFLAWALARELDPGRGVTARYTVLAYALLAWLGPASLAATLALLVAARVVLRPAGRPPGRLDVLAAAALAVTVAWVDPIGAPVGFAVAVAMTLDHSLSGDRPTGLQGLAVPVTVVGVILATAASRSFLGAWRAPGPAELAALVAALAATTQIGVEGARRATDGTGEPLAADRMLRTRQLVAATVVGALLWRGADAVAELAPALAAIIALGAAALARRYRTARGSAATMVVAAVTIIVLSGCAPATEPAGGPTRAATGPAAPGPASPAPTEQTTGRARPVPAAPDAGQLPQDPERLGRLLTRAERLVRDPDLPAERLNGWAHVQQAAYRLLARRPELRRPTRARVPAALHEAYDRNLRAGVQLRRLTEPQEELPRWRIVPPLPPDRLRGIYRDAAQAAGIDWSYLAAIHLVETRMGRIDGVSSAGAQGPMQFIPPTWEQYGAGGEVTDPEDAIPAAARYLADHGAPADMHAALYAYNPSERYIRAVMDYAAVMRADPTVYRAYHQWQVYYRLASGEVLLEVGWSHPDE